MTAITLRFSGMGIRYPRMDGDVGYDLVVAETTTIEAHSFSNVPHDVAVQLPNGYWGLILARSSINLGGKLLVLPGLIDNGYRGKLWAFCHNLSSEPVTIEKGSRICQLVVIQAAVFPLVKDALDQSARSTNGFGSSGGVVERVENPNHTGG